MPETLEKPIILQLSHQDAQLVAAALTLTTEMMLGKEMTLFSILLPNSKISELLSAFTRMTVDPATTNLDECVRLSKLKAYSLGELVASILVQVHPDQAGLGAEVVAKMQSLKQKL